LETGEEKGKIQKRTSTSFRRQNGELKKSAAKMRSKGRKGRGRGLSVRRKEKGQFSQGRTLRFSSDRGGKIDKAMSVEKISGREVRSVFVFEAKEELSKNPSYQGWPKPKKRVAAEGARFIERSKGENFFESVHTRQTQAGMGGKLTSNAEKR